MVMVDRRLRETTTSPKAAKSTCFDNPPGGTYWFTMHWENANKSPSCVSMNFVSRAMPRSLRANALSQSGRGENRIACSFSSHPSRASAASMEANSFAVNACLMCINPWGTS